MQARGPAATLLQYMAHPPESAPVVE